MGKNDAMNSDQLIEYVLGRMDEAELDELGRGIQRDPVLAARVELAERSLRTLLDDGDDYEPPSDLARRTLAVVVQARTRPRTSLEMAPRRPSFRWADLAVAASIFLAGLVTLLPAVQLSRSRMNQAGCVFNLQQLGSSLAQYASLYPSYPYPPSDLADAPTGVFPVLLSEAGVLPDASILDCPCNGPHHPRPKKLPNLQELRRIQEEDPIRYHGLICSDYAFHVGYRNGYGRPGPLESHPAMAIPLVADQPGYNSEGSILKGNSPNHARRGQNVLFTDGSIRWYRTRQVNPNDCDLFLNNDQKVQPGVHVLDSVLVPCDPRFRPWRIR